MKILLLSLSTFFLLHFGYAQNHDYYWPMGYDSFYSDTAYGRTVIDFRDDPVSIYREDRALNFRSTMASFCDSTGNLMFYTNGVQLIGSDHERIGDGDSLNTGYYAGLDYSSGYKVVQSEFFLPKPGNKDTLFLFHESISSHPEYGIARTIMHQTKVDMAANNGLGKVVLKNSPLLTDGAFGSITAVKHGNGRDWWIFNPVNSANRYNRLLFTEGGIVSKEELAFGPEMPFTTALGFLVFSPDGSRFARYEVKHGVSIFGFDRCEGTFHDPVFIPLPGTNLGGGLAVSPNSRFLYVTSTGWVLQFDLWAGDIEASKDTVAVYDGYQSPFTTNFYKMQLGPDGRIYINSTNGVNTLHTIQYPNRKGVACEVRQHSVQLPTYNARTMPHFPNYRLGPLDGSPCDTLGLDNLPIAKFRYEQDTTDYLQVEFTDLSYYEPATWQWDFGDNTTSQDTSPVHVFSQPGSYEACLTVGNMNGEHTFCRTLELGTVSSVEAAQKVSINVFPNPARGGVNITFTNYLPRDAKIVLFDAVGHRHKVQPLQTGRNTLRLDGLQAGIYFYEIWEGELLLKSGKLVKVE